MTEAHTGVSGHILSQGKGRENMGVDSIVSFCGTSLVTCGVSYKTPIPKDCHQPGISLSKDHGFTNELLRAQPNHSTFL